MLHDLDATLRAVLLAGLPEGTTVGFAAPDEAWRKTVAPGPAVNALLVELREDLHARTAHWTEMTDDRQRVIARRAPVRRFRARYVITAWAGAPEDEHALLGAALRVLAATGQTVPADRLAGSLAGLGDAIAVEVAHPDLPGLPVELWSAFGVVPRMGLDVVLIVPLVPEPDRDLARHPDLVDLGVNGGTPTPPAKPEPERPRRRITEGR